MGDDDSDGSVDVDTTDLDDGERLFTQAEVNKIVKDRLSKRERGHQSRQPARDDAGRFDFDYDKLAERVIAKQQEAQLAARKPPAAAPKAPGHSTEPMFPATGYVDIYRMDAEKMSVLQPGQLREFHERNVALAELSHGRPPVKDPHAKIGRR